MAALRALRDKGHMLGSWFLEYLVKRRVFVDLDDK